MTINSCTHNFFSVLNLLLLLDLITINLFIFLNCFHQLIIELLHLIFKFKLDCNSKHGLIPFLFESKRARISYLLKQNLLIISYKFINIQINLVSSFLIQVFQKFNPRKQKLQIKDYFYLAFFTVIYLQDSRLFPQIYHLDLGMINAILIFTVFNRINELRIFQRIFILVNNQFSILLQGQMLFFEVKIRP